MITQELFDACEFAKTAADMSIPVEPMPTPEPGSEAIDGMVNGSMMDPNSVGAGTYAGAVDQAALAQAKARAAAAAQAAAAQKTAAIEEAYAMGYEDAMAEFEEMNKMASVEDAYEMGYAAAMEELEKIAADAYMVIDGQPIQLPDLTARERGEIVNRYAQKAPTLPSKGVPRGLREAVANKPGRKTQAPAINVPTRTRGVSNQEAKLDALLLRGREISNRPTATSGRFSAQPAKTKAPAINIPTETRGVSKSERMLHRAKQGVLGSIGGRRSVTPGVEAAAKANRKAIGNAALVAGSLAAGAGAKYGLHKYLANKRKAKMTRNGLIGAGAAAALAGLGYAAHKARD